MNDRSLLLSLNKITHYLKITTPSGALKKIYCLYKNLMLQIHPLNSSCSQKQQYPERISRLKILRKSSSLEKAAIAKVTHFFFLSIWVSFHEHSLITRLPGKGEGIFLTPHYHLYSLHRHLGISRAIAAGGPPLHITGSRLRTGNLWFPSASR